MIINMVGGGGGAALNFDVVRYATESELLAAIPKANSIGIISTTEMTGWIIDANQPENMTNGMVWLSVGTESTVEFNALKKNALQVYPLFAKQYVSGVLVSIPAMSYQNGAWVAWWNGELFDNGNQYETFTGGWGRNSNIYLGDAGSNTGTVTIDDKIILHPNISSSQCSIATTKKKVNLNNFDTLQVQHASDSANYWVYVHEVTSGGLENNYVATSGKVEANTGAEKATVDISALTGEYYISVATSNKRYVSIEKIKLLR